MKKTLIEQVSSKLDWDYSQTEKIFNDFIEDKERFDWSALEKKDYLRFLEICADSDDPLKRKSNMYQYFSSKLKKNPVELISKLIIDEVVIATYLMFDIKDAIRYGLVTVELPIANPQSILIAYHDLSIKYLETGGIIEFNKAENEVKHELIDFLIRKYISQNTSTVLDREKLTYKELRLERRKIPFEESHTEIIKNLIIDCISHIGIRVFEINFFVGYIKRIASLSPYDFQLERIAHALYSQYLDRKKINDEKYWFYYCLVERLREKGFGLRASFRKAEELINVPNATIARRYFEKKKEAGKYKKSLYTIISSYRFRDKLDMLTQAINN